MSGILGSIITYLEELATKVPLELFAVLGTFIEEAIPPIPSPLIMTLTGTITKAQNQPLSYILFIALIGSIGKTLGSWFVYYVSDKAEDIILGKFGGFFGVTHEDVEKIGKRFNGTWKDELTIGILRAIPVMSTALVSVSCGIIKVNLKSYLVATFVGNIIRNLFFLYIGYTGLEASKSLMGGMETAGTIMKVLFILGLIIPIGYGYYKRSKGTLLKDKTPIE